MDFERHLFLYVAQSSVLMTHYFFLVPCIWAVLSILPAGFFSTVLLQNKKAATPVDGAAALLQWSLSLIQDIHNPCISVDSHLLACFDLLRSLQTSCYARDTILSCHDDRVG